MHNPVAGVRRQSNAEQQQDHEKLALGLRCTPEDLQRFGGLGLPLLLLLFLVVLLASSP